MKKDNNHEKEEMKCLQVCNKEYKIINLLNVIEIYS